MDFPVAPDRTLYNWSRHRKNDDARENIFIYFESIFDGAYKNGAYKYDGAWLQLISVTNWSRGWQFAPSPPPKNEVPKAHRE